ncbi:MAG TPA: class I SAM-dependent methyltransferase [Candidatus Obscuribacterales bacterium]
MTTESLLTPTASAMALDVGCGLNKRPNAVGLDISPLPGVDIVHNLDCYPYPMADDTFDLVYCSSILEHVTDVMATMREIHRVCKNGALVHIALPHYTHAKTYADPTHKHFFSFGVVRYLSGELYGYYGGVKFNVELAMLGQPDGRKTLIKRLFNTNPYWTERIFALFRPIESMYFILRAVK